tara:strand:- start:1406 stop:2899 length:1494 start_codon:yes stop_codon:yes gene_type:complete
MANRPIHVVESGGDSTGLKEFADGADSGVQLPSGTTAQRDSSASAGEIRFNTDTKKIEFYDGTQWNSSSKVFVDDSDFKGVFEIASTTYTDTSEQINFSHTNSPHSSSGLFKFAPDGQNNSIITHSATIDNKMGGLGVVGQNQTEANLALRFSPVLQLTNRPEHGDFNDYDSYYGNSRNMQGAIAFTSRMGPGYGTANENDILLSAITNEVFQNDPDYSGFQIGTMNKMTFHVQNPSVGSFPFMSAGTNPGYAGYQSDGFTQVQINTWNAINVINAKPWTNMTVHEFNRYDMGPFRNPNSNYGSKLRIASQQKEALQSYENAEPNSPFTTAVSQVRGIVFDFVRMADTRTGRTGRIMANLSGWTANDKLQKFYFVAPHSHSGMNFRSHASVELFLYNGGSSDVTFKLPDVADFQFFAHTYDGTGDNLSVSTVASSATENTTGLIHADSSMPTTETAYTVTPKGGLSFEIHVMSVGEQDAFNSFTGKNFVLKNLQTFL